jgi:hypothetical protein
MRNDDQQEAVRRRRGIANGLLIRLDGLDRGHVLSLLCLLGEFFEGSTVS